MKALKLLVAILLAGALLMFPVLADGQGRSGGHGGGGHSGGSHGSGHSGGYYGSHGGGYHGGHHGGYGYYYWGGYYGGPYYRSWGWYYPYFSDFGYPPGYWNGGYYYSNPQNYYRGVCQRFIPTGGYHEESQQDPQTGQQIIVQVQNGYWETVPCR